LKKEFLDDIMHPIFEPAFIRNTKHSQIYKTKKEEKTKAKYYNNPRKSDQCI